MCTIARSQGIRPIRDPRVVVILQNVRNGRQPNVARVGKKAIRMAQISKKMKTKRAHLVDAKKMEAKKTRQEELDEICVVGYQCKLFRDDQRALAIDREEHLIPWMGDASLMIDRYDGRGHLPSLSEYEESWNSRRQEISAEEERIETLCDEERYMALHKDMMEEELRQEEEIKRLNLAIASSDSSYNQVAFSYDQGKDEYDPMKPTEDEEQFAKTPPQCKSPEAELEEPFIAPPEMNIPIGVEMPGTKKTHKFMEKTAMFIINQGAQMEIILKTKQANNPQFDFLQFDHYLNPYYKHLLKCIKNGKYKGLPDDEEEEDNHKKQGGNNRVRKHSNASSSEDDDDDDDNDNSGYLHPSLLGQSRPRPTPMQAGTTTIQTHSTSMPPASSYHPSMDFSKPPPIMGYHDPNFLPPAADPQLMGPSGYYDQNVYPMFQPPPPPPPSGAALSLPTVPPPHFSGVDPAYVMANPHPTLPPSHGHAAPLGMDPNVLPHQESPPVPPAADISEADAPRVIPPPPDIQPVIDKLAKFVAKNGIDFEASVRSKSDPRFDFLLPWHKYNAYYVQKKKMFISEMGGKEEEEGARQEEKTKKVSVSFSIKPKTSKEERPLERKSALPIESSDSEEEEEKPASRLPPPEILTRAGSEGREVKGDNQEGQKAWGDDYPGQPPFNPAFRGGPFADRTELPPYEGPYQEGRYREPAYCEPPALRYSEYPDPYTEQDGSQLRGVYDRGRGITEEEWQMRQAKLRLEDRLASAAREKMASASKERIQQMERRKKAAVFLSMIKDRPQAGAAAELDNMEADPDNIPPAESAIPPEKQRKTDSRSERKKHKKHKHRHGSSSGSSRRSPSPDKKHKRPPRSYQDANRVSSSSSREGDKPRARSTSPGVRSRPVTPPRSYQMPRNRSPKRRRRSRSRSNSPVRPIWSSESLPRRASSLEVSSLPTKSRSLSPENTRNNPATSVVPMVLDATPPPPTATPPLPSEPTPNNSVSISTNEPPKEATEENGTTTTTSTTAATTTDTSFQDNFRAKIRAMLAATRTMDFSPS